MHRWLLLAALGVAALPRGAAAQAVEVRDTLRGTVLDTAGEPVQDANVEVRSVRTLVLRTAITDADGRWQVVFPDTASAYEVAISRIGKRSARVRLEREPGSGWSNPVTILDDEAIALPGIEVRPQRPMVIRDRPGALPHERSGSQFYEYGEETLLTRGDPNELGALASGAALLEDGFSVAGLPSTQNRVTVNGMTFGGRYLPNFAVVESYTTAASASAARGGFTGGEVAIGLWQGDYQPTQLFLQGFATDPSWQLAGPAGDPLGVRYGRRELRTGFQRGLFDQKIGIALAADVERRTRPLATILGSAGTLHGIGLAPDSADRLLGILEGGGIPFDAGGSVDTETSDRVTLSANLTIPRTFWDLNGQLSAVVSRRSSSPLGVGPSTFASAGQRARHGSTDINLALSRDIGNNVLHDVGLAFHRSSDHSTALTRLPAGRVTIASEAEGDSAGLANIGFGGSGSADRESQRTFFEVRHDMRWMAFDTTHEYRLGWQVHAGRDEEFGGGNQLGTFTFRSLADLEAGRPASFSRTLDTSQRTAQGLNAAAFFEDQWRASHRLELRYGLRLEGSRYGKADSPLPDIDARFDVRSRRIPSDLRLLPRIGFAWYSKPILRGWDTRPPSPSDQHRPPFGELSGSIGAYRDWIGPGALLPYSTPEGGVASTLMCVGDAVPVPAWSSYRDEPASAPTQCTDGSTASPAASLTPDVAVFDRDFEAPYAWKANLGWRGRARWLRLSPGGARLTLEGTYTRAGAQPSELDLNFDPTVRFTLPEEAGRPVFASPSDVVPGTGAIGPLASRRLDDYGRVAAVRSDGRIETWGFTARIEPYFYSYPWRYRLTYTRSWSRELQRGFVLPTGGDPSTLRWAPGSFPDHVLHGFLDIPLLRDGADLNLDLRLTGRLQSGTRFTPTVLGDVNGDGLAGNDAAFVFDPAHTSDPELAAGMRALLERAEPRTRKCLERYLARVAGRNGCIGPWTAGLDARLTAYLGSRFPLQGARISLLATNVLGGIDHLLHVDQIRGWGEQPFVDPVLLSVRGFGPRRRAFRYEVNPRFGHAPAASRSLRQPFTLQLIVSFDLGKTWDRVALDRTLHNVQEASTAEDTIQELSWFMNVSNRMRLMLSSPTYADRMLLTREQKQVLARWADQFDAEAETLQGDSFRYLVRAAGREPTDEVYDRVWPAREAAERLDIAYVRCLKQLLSEDQWLRSISSVDRAEANGPPRPDDPKPACALELAAER